MPRLSYWLSKHLSSGSFGAGRTGNIIAIIGVAFAVAVMEITMAVSSGFQESIQKKLEGFIAPVTLTATQSSSSENVSPLFQIDSTLRHSIQNVRPDATLTGAMWLPGIIKTDDDFYVYALKGYENDFSAEFEKNNLTAGHWLSTEKPNYIVVSEDIARKLGLSLGDKIDFCIFTDNSVKVRRFEIGGLYNSGFSEYDKNIGYANISDLRKVYHVDSTFVTSLELRHLTVSEAPGVTSALHEQLSLNALQSDKPSHSLNATSINQTGAIYLNWLDLLDTNVVVIFILMALVAMTTLISSLFIQVLDKVGTIGLLMAIGAKKSLISRIFVNLSLKLAFCGLIAGNIVGLSLIYLQNQFHFIKLDPAMYYLSEVPVSISPLSIVVLNLIVFAAVWLILFIPARIATNISPSNTLRYE